MENGELEDEEMDWQLR